MLYWRGLGRRFRSNRIGLRDARGVEREYIPNFWPNRSASRDDPCPSMKKAMGTLGRCFSELDIKRWRLTVLSWMPPAGKAHEMRASFTRTFRVRCRRKRSGYSSALLLRCCVWDTAHWPASRLKIGLCPSVASREGLGTTLAIVATTICQRSSELIRIPIE